MLRSQKSPGRKEKIEKQLNKHSVCVIIVSGESKEKRDFYEDRKTLGFVAFNVMRCGNR